MHPIVASSSFASTPPAFVPPPVSLAAPSLRIRAGPTLDRLPPLSRSREWRSTAWPLAGARTTEPEPERGGGKAGGSLPLWARDGSKPWRATLALMAVYSAILGPFLDGYHGLYGVLVYDRLRINLDVAGAHILGTSVWVPPMFGFAGLMMTVLCAYVRPCVAGADCS